MYFPSLVWCKCCLMLDRWCHIIRNSYHWSCGCFNLFIYFSRFLPYNTSSMITDYNVTRQYCTSSCSYAHFIFSDLHTFEFIHWCFYNKNLSVSTKYLVLYNITLFLQNRISAWNVIVLITIYGHCVIQVCFSSPPLQLSAFCFILKPIFFFKLISLALNSVCGSD